jgi:hypothetical protein
MHEEVSPKGLTWKADQRNPVCMKVRTFVMRSLVCVLCVLNSGTAFAGIFNTVHFVEPGKSAVGIEPEFTTSDGTGFGFNAKFTQGISELMDAAGFIGTGSGPRNFRVGGDLVFDFFPDIDRQPGIGLLTRAVYYRIPNTGRLDIFGAPYIHKAMMTSGKDEIDPFFAFPIGQEFDNGNYHTTTQLVFGSMFKATEQLRYSLELGINLNYTETYISGGITFYP